jgi:DNA-binding LytR/AlgR family response regulator
MKVIIVEDEKLAVERLQLLLRQIDAGIQIIAAIESVEQGITLFHQRVPEADVLLMDIHLSDGSVFDLFRHVNINIPIIFTTAYDQYAIDAFKVLSIDYLLKPITLESLTKALEKMRILTKNPSLPKPNYSLLGEYVPFRRSSFRSRFLGRIGQKGYFVNAGDIALISVDNRLVQITTMDKTTYIVDHTLEELERDLDPTAFFRINRSMIVQATAISQVKPFLNHRLRLTLKGALHDENIVVSRDRTADFKKWADS